MAGQINIGDTWKAIAGMQVNIGDTWKTVASAQINIGDTWKPWYASVAAPTGMTAYWHLEDVNDSSGNGYTLTNNGTVTFGAGKINNCADNIQNGKSLTITSNLGISSGNITVCLWVYPTSTTIGDHDAYFSKYDDTIHADYRIGQTGTNFFVARHTPSVAWNQIVTGYTLNAWTHLALVYSSTTLTGYKNGVSFGSITATGTGGGSYTTATKLGVGNATSTAYFIGKLDEVIVYNRALSGTEIAQIYNLT